MEENMKKNPEETPEEVPAEEAPVQEAPAEEAPAEEVQEPEERLEHMDWDSVLQNGAQEAAAEFSAEFSAPGAEDWEEDEPSSGKKKLLLILGMIVAVILAGFLAYGVYGHTVTVRYENLMNEGEAYFQKQDYEKALTKYESAYRTKDTDEAAIALAETWSAIGDKEAAIMIITNRMENHSSNPRLEELLHKYQDEAGMFDNVTIGGETIPVDSTAIILEDVVLSDEDLALIGQFENLMTLSLKNCALTSLDFLKNNDKLMSLTITNNQVKDLSPLMDKKSLKTLYVNDNPIEDFTPLYGLTQLTTLNVRGIWITSTQLDELRQKLSTTTIYGGENMVIQAYSLGGVDFLSDVKELNLSGKGITDISVLKNCTQLERLDLSGNNISYLGGLEQVRTLKWLDLSDNKISNVSALDTLTNLTYLDLENNQVSSIMPLSSLVNLQELYLSGNPVYNGHQALSHMTVLQKLTLKGTQLNNNGFGMIPTQALKELDVSANPNLTDTVVLSFKEAHPGMNIIHDEYKTTVDLGSKSFQRNEPKVDASNAGVSDISPLSQFTNLQELNLSGNTIGNFQHLKPLTGLTALELQGTGLSDASILVNMTKLTKLNLAENNLRNIYALAQMPELTEVDLSGNVKLSDINPLSYCKKLETLHLENCPVTNYSVLYGLTGLKNLYLEGTGITDQQLKDLQAALPGCTIHGVTAATPAPTPVPVTPVPQTVTPTPGIEVVPQNTPSVEIIAPVPGENELEIN